MGEPTSAARTGPIIAAAALAQVTVTLDYFALTVALPEMSHDLDTTPADLQWALSIYLLTFAALVIAGGRLGDTLGRRRVFLIGLGIFAFASAAAGIAPTAGWLVVGRALMGVGAAMLFPTSMAVVQSSFPQQRRAAAVGLVVGLASVGAAVGPFVGGALTQHLGWRWIFYLNVAVAVLAFVLVVAVVRESRDPSAARSVDVAGLLTMAGGAIGLVLVADQGEEWGWASPATLGVLGGALALLAIFVVVERRTRAPLVELPLFRSRDFVGITSAAVLANYLFGSLAFAVTLYLQVARRLTPLEAGAMYLPMSGVFALVGPYAGRLLPRAGARTLMVAGLVGTALAMGVLTTVSAGSSLLVLGLGMAVMGTGLSVAYTTANTGGMAVVPAEKAGEASGVVLMVLLVFAAFGNAVAASVVDHQQAVAGSAEGVVVAFRILMVVGLVVAGVAATLAAALIRRRAGRTA